MSRHAIVADRYMYLSYVGIAFLIANGIWWLRKRLSYFKAALSFLLLFLFVSIYFSLYKKEGKHNDGEEIHKRSIRKKVEWK